jgi:chromosome segregation ATPase
MTEMQNTRTLEVVAAEIRTFTASMLNNIIEIGRRLCEAKELVPYGSFGTWVKENTGYSSSTANNFMRLYQEYGAAQGSLFGATVEDFQTFGKLSYSKALALLQLPSGEREEFVRENDVEAMSTRELNEAIRERDEAKQKLTEVARAFDESQERVQRDQVEIRDLREKIDELESRPVDVAVQEPDPAEIQKRIDVAVAEAVKEAKSAAAEDKKKLRDKLAAAEKDLQAAKKEAETQAKAAADKEKQLVEQQAGIVSMEKERLEREVETLKKQIAMSDAAVVTFNALFAQVQDVMNRLMGAMAKVDDAETAEKLRAALRKLLAIYGEKVGA